MLISRDGSIFFTIPLSAIADSHFFCLKIAVAVSSFFSSEVGVGAGGCVDGSAMLFVQSNLKGTERDKMESKAESEQQERNKGAT